MSAPEWTARAGITQRNHVDFIQFEARLNIAAYSSMSIFCANDKAAAECAKDVARASLDDILYGDARHDLRELEIMMLKESHRSSLAAEAVRRIGKIREALKPRGL